MLDFIAYYRRKIVDVKGMLRKKLQFAALMLIGRGKWFRSG